MSKAIFNIIFFSTCFFTLAEAQVLCLKSSGENSNRIQVNMPNQGHKTGEIHFEKSSNKFVIYRRSEIIESSGPPATVKQEFIAFLGGRIKGTFWLTTMGAAIGEASFSKLDRSSPEEFFDDQDSQGPKNCDWLKGSR